MEPLELGGSLALRVRPLEELPVKCATVALLDHDDIFAGSPRIIDGDMKRLNIAHGYLLLYA
jgi:hypothetical protein